jgi:hypothetical protein
LERGARSAIGFVSAHIAQKWAEDCGRDDIFETAADALVSINEALETVADPDDQDDPE